MYSIPLSKTTIASEEQTAAQRVLESGWLTMGPEVEAFETEFARALGVSHAVAVANGTAALEGLFEACGIRNRRVLVPALTFVADFNVAWHAGNEIVLVDVTSQDDLTLSLDDVEAKARPGDAVIAMPYGGFPPDMERLEALARKHSLVLVEDACHAPLAKTEAGGPIGGFGMGAAWSFFGNKNMTTGEGGMVTTNHLHIRDHLRKFRSHGMTRMTWERSQGEGFRYDVEMPGRNLRLDEMRAAVGREQLKKLPVTNRARAIASGWLRAAVTSLKIEGLEIPFSRHRGTSANHLFVVLLPPGIDRGRVMEEMANDGVQTSVHYPLIHTLQYPRSYFGAGRGSCADLPIAESIAPRLLTLPLFPQLTEDEAQTVAEVLARALNRAF